MYMEYYFHTCLESHFRNRLRYSIPLSLTKTLLESMKEALVDTTQKRVSTVNQNAYLVLGVPVPSAKAALLMRSALSTSFRIGLLAVGASLVNFLAAKHSFDDAVTNAGLAKFTVKAEKDSAMFLILLALGFSLFCAFVIPGFIFLGARNNHACAFHTVRYLALFHRLLLTMTLIVLPLFCFDLYYVVPSILYGKYDSSNIFIRTRFKYSCELMYHD